MVILKSIRLDQIWLDVALQSRVKMSTNKVQEYSNAHKNGIKFPPVMVYRDDNGANHLLDGWHRIQAYKNCEEKGHFKIQVNVLQDTKGMNVHALRYIGAMQNATQGMPLTNADKRILFKDYVKGKHNKQGTNYKTYREIAKDLCSIPHQTIARWMLEDFPRTARAMGRGEMESQPSANGTGNRMVDMPDLSSREMELLVSDVIEQAKLATSNDQIEQYIKQCNDLVVVLKGLPKLPDKAVAIYPTNADF